MKVTNQTCGVSYPRALWFSMGTRGIANPNRTLSAGSKEEEDTNIIREGPIKRAKDQRSQASRTDRLTSRRPEPTAPAANQYLRHYPSTYPTTGKPARGGSPQILPGELGANNLGPMDPAGGDGVPFGVNLRTTTRQTTQADTAYNGAKQDDSRQNPGTGTEVGDTEGQTPTGPVYQPDLPSPQEGRIAATSGQSEAAELFDGKMQIQNGERENIEGPGEEERLDGLDRPEGRLSLGTNQGGGQEVSPVCMGGESVRVSVSPLWPQQCSKGFHEATETGNGPPQTEGATEHDLPRRYVADGRIKTRSGTPVTGSPGPSQAAGVQDQLGKVSATPNTQTGVSGPHN